MHEKESPKKSAKVNSAYIYYGCSLHLQRWSLHIAVTVTQNMACDTNINLVLELQINVYIMSKHQQNFRTLNL